MISLSKIFLFSILSFFILLPFYGQSQEKELSEQEFINILGQYQNFSKMEVGFSQIKTLADLNIKMLSEGKLQVSRPDSVLWQIQKPSFMKVMINAKEISMQTEKNKPEVWPIDQIPEKMAKNLKEMILWLKFDAPALYQNFHIYYQAKGKDSDKDLATYLLKPRNNNDDHFNFTSIAMTVGSNKNVKNVKMIEKSGDSIDINFHEPLFQK